MIEQEEVPRIVALKVFFMSLRLGGVFEHPFHLGTLDDCLQMVSLSAAACSQKSAAEFHLEAQELRWSREENAFP